ncbi:Sodium/hydrogen exchanger family-domain-containing protein [Zychaea mexicana]|uniref:Sodium/hydrogen exchanger family-domain-containing protein n=1 Tax=Zychaea mexicana TaxID=64656 RepID=UPI0022FDB818|nr:Sodium/hydrogen exchanger family-domain-containing protein [Zychaea mexicana]KAI9499299.1 Sodium/hydrogen exchanger family-domain-containing protein [Zychaea mexicana]
MNLALLSLAFLLFCLGTVTGDPQTLDASQIHAVLQQGQQYKHELQLEKQRFHDSIKAYNADNDAGLFRLAGVKLDDFTAFENLVFGMFEIYGQTVHRKHGTYDFRTPALKLTFDFQLAIKESHVHLKSHSFDELSRMTQSPPPPKDLEGNDEEAAIEKSPKTAVTGYTPHHVHSEGDAPDSREAIQEMLHGMLQDVRQNADQLEQGMHQHNLAFPSSGEGATIETVLKLNDEDTQEDENAVLIDQDNNEYIMTRPFDTTVIYEDMQLLHDFILIVVTSFGFGWLFSIMGLPVTGPSGYNLIRELIQTETLAQLGVVFIVFVLGLEFSLEKLRAMWRLVLGGAMMILVVTVLFFVIMGAILGASMKEAIFVGACVSLSSTAVVVKCIKLDHLEHLYGLLVMQDVLLGFMLAIIPALAESGVQVLFAVLKIALSFSVFGSLCFAIVKLMPLLPRVIHKAFPNLKVAYNHELVVLGTIAVCLVMLLVSDYLGLGMEIGCFAAGVIVRSRKNLFESALAVIEPVRDLFACLFFASIGLHVYPSFLASEAILLLTLAGGVIGFKYIATSVILVFLKLDFRKSSTMAIALAQISEFGFVLASRAKQLDIISREVYYLLLAVTSLTLLSTPLLWKLMNRSSLLHDPTTSSGNQSTIPSSILPSSSSSSSSAAAAAAASINHHHHPHHRLHQHQQHSRDPDDHHPVISISLDDSADKFA